MPSLSTRSEDAWLEPTSWHEDEERAHEAAADAEMDRLAYAVEPEHQTAPAPRARERATPAAADASASSEVAAESDGAPEPPASKLALALSYVARGWKVLVLGGQKKTPINSWRYGQRDGFDPEHLMSLAFGDERNEYLRGFAASSDPRLVAAWISQWPDCGLAIDCRESRLFVIDLDQHDGKDGRAALEKIARDHFGSDVAGGGPGSPCGEPLRSRSCRRRRLGARGDAHGEGRGGQSGAQRERRVHAARDPRPALRVRRGPLPPSQRGAVFVGVVRAVAPADHDFSRLVTSFSERWEQRHALLKPINRLERAPAGLLGLGELENAECLALEALDLTKQVVSSVIPGRSRRTF